MKNGSMRKRMISLAAFLLLIALLLGGCGKALETENRQDTDPEKKLQIGMTFDSFVIERWTRDRDVFVSQAQSLGAEVNVQNAHGNIEEQISQIDYFIKKNMDVIVIIAVDCSALSDAVSRARDKGIRVVSYDRLLLNCQSDLYISFDNEKVGFLMGDALVKSMPEGGSIFAIHGSQSDNNVTMLRQGLEKALEGTGVEIVYSTYCENWLAELAFDAVNEGLKETGDVQGIMCGNDDLAGQAIKALSEHRLAGKIPVVGQDADLAACQRIVEGTQTMTVYKSVEDLARKAARLAVALGNGEDITGEGAKNRVTKTISAGNCEVPYYSITPTAVTADNMDEVIVNSGFHQREEVYLNVSKF